MRWQSHGASARYCTLACTRCCSRRRITGITVRRSERSPWASPAEYAALAARVPAGSTVESFGEVGAVAYFCDCTVVDRFSDRAQVADLLRAKRAAAGPVVRTLLDWNYYRLRTEPPIPATYEFAFAEDPAGIDVTSWLPYRGQMVVRRSG